MAKSRRAKKQISKVNPKMGYFGGPNMPLSQKSGFKTILVSFWRPNREEREKREKKRRRRRRVDQAKGMETHLVYESYEIMHEFPCFDGYPLAQI